MYMDYLLITFDFDIYRGECKFSLTDGGHQDWVSCVRFSPNPANPVIVSGGWDKLVKVNICLHFLLNK